MNAKHAVDGYVQELLYRSSPGNNYPYVPLKAMQNRPKSRETGRLQQLHRWLTFGGGSMILGGTGLILPMGIVLIVMTWGAVLFTPFLLWQLYQIKKPQWIIGFLVVVGLPLLGSFFVENVSVFGLILSMMPLSMFYLYTWMLRHYVEEWIEVTRWKRHDELRQRYKER